MLNKKHRFYGKTKKLDNCPVIAQKGSDAFSLMMTF